MNLSLNRQFLFCLVTFLSWIFVFNLYFDIFISLFLLIFWFIILLNYSLFLWKKWFNKFIFLLFFSSVFWIIIWQINYNNIADKQLKVEKVTHWYSNKIGLELQIVNTYKKYENYTSYVWKIVSANNEKLGNINLLVNFFWKDKLYQNDKIIVDTQVDKINNFVSTFDYENFMKTKNIYGSTNIYFIERDKIIRWKPWFIYSTRQKLLDIVSTTFPKQEANLLSWILIGSRQNLSKDLQDNFNNSW